MDRNERWKLYYRRTRDERPSELLIEAVSLVRERGKALDLGACALRDSKYLLELGFFVVAVDSCPLVLNEAASVRHQNLSAIISSFDTYIFPKGAFDLINAEYSLPFNSPDTFGGMFARVSNSLKEGGVFVGQFFGKNDSWNIPDSNMTFHSREDVKDALKNFTVIKMIAEEKDEKSTLGKMKHWHIFHVIAQKQKA